MVSDGWADARMIFWVNVDKGDSINNDSWLALMRR